MDIAAHQTSVTRSGGGVKTLRLGAELREKILCIIGLGSARRRVPLQQAGRAGMIRDFIRQALVAPHARWRAGATVLDLLVKVDGDRQKAVVKVSAQSMRICKLPLEKGV